MPGENQRSCASAEAASVDPMHWIAQTHTTADDGLSRIQFPPDIGAIERMKHAASICPWHFVGAKLTLNWYRYQDTDTNLPPAAYNRPRKSWFAGAKRSRLLRVGRPEGYPPHQGDSWQVSIGVVDPSARLDSRGVIGHVTYRNSCAQAFGRRTSHPRMLGSGHFETDQPIA